MAVELDSPIIGLSELVEWVGEFGDTENFSSSDERLEEEIWVEFEAVMEYFWTHSGEVTACEIEQLATFRETMVAAVAAAKLRNGRLLLTLYCILDIHYPQKKRGLSTPSLAYD